jgi:hypothetical protein
MALFTGIRQSFTSYVSPRKPPTIDRLLTPPASDHSPELDLQIPPNHARNFESDTHLEGDTLVASTTKSRKRPLEDKISQATARKKHKNFDHAFSPEDDSDSDFEGGILETSTPPQARARSKPTTMKEAADRALMPPPATPTYQERKHASPKVLVDKGVEDYKYIGNPTDELSEEEAFTSSTAIRKNGPKEVVDFDEQKALRYAEAVKLPETGETWAEAEKDLFYRLAFRGFEPLVPANWANDFKTLPSSLFSNDGDDPPLIQSHLQREFRGIHGLRSLFSMGTIIRDRALSRRKLRPEPILRRTVKKYISWALADVGLHPLQRPNAVPVHCLVTMRRGETTQATINTISEKLHELAERYRIVYGVRESIEPKDSAFVSSEVTNSEDSRLPVLTGLMICSSLIAVVTLNPATQFTAHISTTTNLRRSLQEAKDESGVRFIATFDFSEDGMDVWNALAIAICVMRIRKTMMELCERGEANGENGRGGLWERVIVKGSTANKEDPDI